MAKSSPAPTDARLGNALLAAMPGERRRQQALKHGWRILRSDGQIASGYVSDNAEHNGQCNGAELALNPEKLVEYPLERPALLRWLHYERKRRGDRTVNTHQRGDPVAWFRIGFLSVDEALDFLQQFRIERAENDYRRRWLTPEGTSGAESGLPAAASGNRTNEELAIACIPILIAHVLDQSDDVMRTMTYEELAEQLDRRDLHGHPMALGMGDVLARAMVHIDRAAAMLQEQVPYLTTVVVDKTGEDRGLPGRGVKDRWPDYPGLSHDEKADRAELEYQRILHYGRRWLDVLSVLGLPAELTDRAAGAGGGRAGGESQAHKILKEFIAATPSLVGASKNATSRCEFALRSADEIDVLFQSPEEWVGVEVKASTWGTAEIKQIFGYKRKSNL